MNLTKKNIPFRQEKKEKQVFQQLKDTLTNEPILIIPNPKKPFEVKTNASNASYSAILF